MTVSRVLPASPLAGLADYQAIGGGAGLDAARRLGTDGVIEHLLASGLRGRGGAGFPTGRKWATVRDYESPDVPGDGGRERGRRRAGLVQGPCHPPRQSLSPSSKAR